jgi:hypothetical protein
MERRKIACHELYGRISRRDTDAGGNGSAFFGAAADQNNLRPALGQRLGGDFANAGCGAGDDGDFALQFCLHVNQLTSLDSFWNTKNQREQRDD